VKDHSQGDK